MRQGDNITEVRVRIMSYNRVVVVNYVVGSVHVRFIPNTFVYILHLNLFKCYLSFYTEYTL